jgi:hypothetical protein
LPATSTDSGKIRVASKIVVPVQVDAAPSIKAAYKGADVFEATFLMLFQGASCFRQQAPLLLSSAPLQIVAGAHKRLGACLTAAWHPALDRTNFSSLQTTDRSKLVTSPTGGDRE